jgi:putative hydrolase of HD superfamily
MIYFIQEVYTMQNLAQFLFEVGYLKRVRRSGWWLLGNKTPESVAEHSFRCTIIGYLLARSEKLMPLR